MHFSVSTTNMSSSRSICSALRILSFVGIKITTVCFACANGPFLFSAMAFVRRTVASSDIENYGLLETKISIPFGRVRKGCGELFLLHDFCISAENVCSENTRNSLIFESAILPLPFDFPICFHDSLIIIND